MKLDDFINILLEDVSKFKDFYLEGHKENPEEFPLELEEGDWLEQFLMFINTEE